jgi:hypothetical protein
MASSNLQKRVVCETMLGDFLQLARVGNRPSAELPACQAGCYEDGDQPTRQILNYRIYFMPQVHGGRLIPLAPALPTCGDERAIGARLRPATDKMLIAPEATA